MIKIFNTYKNKNFTVLSVSLDNIKGSWLKAIREDQLPWMQVSDLKGYDAGGIARLYAIHGVPQNFLIDPNGKIVEKTVQSVDLIDDLKRILTVLDNGTEQQ